MGVLDDYLYKKQTQYNKYARYMPSYTRAKAKSEINEIKKRIPTQTANQRFRQADNRSVSPKLLVDPPPKNTNQNGGDNAEKPKTSGSNGVSTQNFREAEQQSLDKYEVYKMIKDAMERMLNTGHEIDEATLEAEIPEAMLRDNPDMLDDIAKQVADEMEDRNGLNDEYDIDVIAEGFEEDRNNYDAKYSPLVPGPMQDRFMDDIHDIIDGTDLPKKEYVDPRGFLYPPENGFWYDPNQDISDLHDESLVDYYEWFDDSFDTGTYYIDKSGSISEVLGYNTGVTYLINLDEEYVALYKHEGVSISVGLSPASLQYSYGKVEGDTSDPINYTKWFFQNTSAPVFIDEEAKAIGNGAKNDKNRITQENMNGMVSNFGAGFGWDYYTLLKTIDMDGEAETGE